MYSKTFDAIKLKFRLKDNRLNGDFLLARGSNKSAYGVRWISYSGLLHCLDTLTFYEHINYNLSLYLSKVVVYKYLFNEITICAFVSVMRYSHVISVLCTSSFRFKSLFLRKKKCSLFYMFITKTCPCNI